MKVHNVQWEEWEEGKAGKKKKEEEAGMERNGRQLQRLPQGTPDPLQSTFIPVVRRVKTSIMYTGNGFMPEDFAFFHSKVSTTRC